MAKINLGDILGAARRAFYRTKGDVSRDIGKYMRQAEFDVAQRHGFSDIPDPMRLKPLRWNALQNEVNTHYNQMYAPLVNSKTGLTGFSKGLLTAGGTGAVLGGAGNLWSNTTGLEHLQTPEMRDVKSNVDKFGLIASLVPLAHGNPAAAASLLSGLVVKDAVLPVGDAILTTQKNRAQITEAEKQQALTNLSIAKENLQAATAQQAAAKTNAELQKKMLEEQNKFKWRDAALLGALALGMGGVGLYAYNSLFKKQPVEKKKIRVTLPTKEKGDQETVVELDADELPASMQEKLKRDAKRRLRKEIEERTYRKAIEQAVSKIEGKPWSASQEQQMAQTNSVTSSV